MIEACARGLSRPPAGSPWRDRSPWGRLIADEGGAVLIYATAVLGVVLGFGALVIDAGRLASVQSELQAFADHVALAAAGELDGRPGAIARATNAAQLISADRETLGVAPRLLDPATDITLRFLDSLPPSDNDPITDAHVTVDDAEAVYVEVTVTPSNVDYWLLPAFAAVLGIDEEAVGAVGASAVAGFNQFMCDAAPLMFCSPDGPSYTPQPGRQIKLKTDNFWGPGAFGLLDNNFDPDGPCGAPNQGAEYYRCVLAATQSVTRCFSRRGVDVRPGQVTGAAASGFNVRFDIYETNLQSKRNDALFAPAPNVVKGIGPTGGGQCIQGSYEAYPDSQPLPRDSCFATDSCGHNGSFGNGEWDKEGYWAMNHGGTPPPASTRYELYLAEIDQAPSPSRILPAPRTETGRPECSNSAPAPPDRRLLNAAVVDCSNLPPGNATNVPVVTFTSLFMTEPAGIEGGNESTALWVEEVGELTPWGGGNSFVHDVVQLFR